jgi:hypothetical protein
MPEHLWFHKCPCASVRFALASVARGLRQNHGYAYVGDERGRRGFDNERHSHDSGSLGPFPTIASLRLPLRLYPPVDLSEIFISCGTRFPILEVCDKKSRINQQQKITIYLQHSHGKIRKSQEDRTWVLAKYQSGYCILTLRRGVREVSCSTTSSLAVS